MAEAGGTGPNDELAWHATGVPKATLHPFRCPAQVSAPLGPLP